MKYRIYGKSIYDKRFRALDLTEGVLTSNLLYATIFDSKEQAEDIVSHLNEENKNNYTFEVRKVG